MFCWGKKQFDRRQTQINVTDEKILKFPDVYFKSISASSLIVEPKIIHLLICKFIAMHLNFKFVLIHIFSETLKIKGYMQ